MSGTPTRPRVFAMARADARMNNPTSRSVRLVTPESTGQARLYAGAFWSDPGADAGWAFVPDDPDRNTMAGGIPHLGDHDEVVLPDRVIDGFYRDAQFFGGGFECFVALRRILDRFDPLVGEIEKRDVRGHGQPPSLGKLWRRSLSNMPG